MNVSFFSVMILLCFKSLNHSSGPPQCKQATFTGDRCDKVRFVGTGAPPQLQAPIAAPNVHINDQKKAKKWIFIFNAN